VVPAPEVFVAFQFSAGSAPRATSVRSTLIVSAIQTLRRRGHFDRYLAELTLQSRQDLLSLIAGVWIPIDLALDHYQAVERLRLEAEEIERIGGEVAERISRSILSTVVRVSRQVGATPWMALAQVHRLRDLSWKGSDIAVWKLGPKEDWIGQPLAAVPYFVTSFGGYLRALVQLFSSKVYTRVACEPNSRGEIRYRISWV
jgi:hypothetical protein